jgi:hypothetical protein
MKLGHTATGGGASITNSPINVHIHIHCGSEPIAEKIKRKLHELVGRRTFAIENAATIPVEQLSGIINRECADR